MRPLVPRLLIALFAATFAFAQTEPPPPQFAEEIEVRVIDVDVVVTDRQGNHLTNLTRDDFELYEDGKRIDIAYFSRIVDGRIADLPPAPEQAGATAPSLPAPRTPLTWVVYIDQTNLAPQRRNQALRQLQTFLATSLAGGDKGMIASNDGRSFKLRQPMTEDAKLLMQTLATIEKERPVLGAAINKANAVRNEISRAELGDPQLEFVAQSIAHEISYVIEEEANRTRNAIMAMQALLEGVARLEGRIALVYVGSGFTTLPGMQLTEAWNAKFRMYQNANFAPEPDRHREALARDIARLYTNFSAMRVSVYTIHGGDLGGGPTTVEDAGSLEPSAVSPSADRAQLTEAGLAREMADRTGGRYFKVSQALASQMEVVRRDLSNYYSLGYKPEGKPSDTRRVKVKVKVDGARVRHRESVRERTRTEKAAGAVVAAMVQPQQRVAQKIQRAPELPAADVSAANPLGAKVEPERVRPDGWGRDYVLPYRFSLNLDALTFTRRGAVHRADFTMHFALVAPDGAVYPLESREQSLSIPDAELKKATGTELVSYSWHVDLAPLKISGDIPVKQEGMRLSVTVEDRTSGTRSVITAPIAK